MLLSGMIAASIGWEWVFYIFGKSASQFTILSISIYVHIYTFVCKVNIGNVKCAHGKKHFDSRNYLLDKVKLRREISRTRGILNPNFKPNIPIYMHIRLIYNYSLYTILSS